MKHNNIDHYDDYYIRNILKRTKSIAIVGLSDRENRPSYFAAKYLKEKGYNIIPVNPVTKKKTILGKRVFKKLSELKFCPDMVDIFLSQDKIMDCVKEAIKIKPKTIWLQLGLYNKKALQIARNNNIDFIMNRCPKIEYARLRGEIGWAGVNSNLISNKKLL